MSDPYVTNDILVASKLLKNGKVGVLPTDTVYGIMAVASNKYAVDKIYDIKTRPTDKPLIVLISNIIQLKDFGIDDVYINSASKYWPNPVTIIVPVKTTKYSYISSKNTTIAFRLPKYKPITDIINLTGPLVAPSANPSGLLPANTIEQAVKYFNDKIDFYLNLGICNNPPSKIIDLVTGTVHRK